MMSPTYIAPPMSPIHTQNERSHIDVEPIMIEDTPNPPSYMNLPHMSILRNIDTNALKSSKRGRPSISQAIKP